MVMFNWFIFTITQCIFNSWNGWFCKQNIQYSKNTDSYLGFHQVVKIVFKPQIGALKFSSLDFVKMVPWNWL